MKLKALALAALFVSPLVSAQMDLMAHHPYARAMAPGAVNSAVFVELMNRSDNVRTIVAAETPAAGKVELHDVIKEGDVMKMRQVESIEIPAKGKTVLKPGSLHIMLFDLKAPLNEGEQIDVTVTFANGEKMTFKAPVKKVMTGMQHSGH
ncbi:copper chaperone PCu(A)C [Vibrio vulnificus]|nr:copper chaperone PCu(A)C [Vibrio vulnificus]EGQ8075125.1 copper chaperone PCu(A)C [Vibrio vulnificus]EHH0680955.1 copper chaperone PCu(A)C [Vibrio vulnificus]EHH0710194.1 copper chaperone PCu(A)C [Vibrio vulnificus]EHH1185138.1 copper chaperone PCu(A)C [Vibrio vulnificus]